MVKKIISGGQTGADQAALDAAIELAIPYGGWVPKGRKTEAGPLPYKYILQEMPTGSYIKRTEQNVIDSDGTLVICHGRPRGKSAMALKLAKKHDRPCLHIDTFQTVNALYAAKIIDRWTKGNRIEVLHVAGPRASKDPQIYEIASRIIRMSFDFVALCEPIRFSMPATVEEAVEWLESDLSLKDKTALANMPEHHLDSLPPTLGEYIWDRYGLEKENRDLIQSCRIHTGFDYREGNCPKIIIRELWKKLRETYRLRVVK